MPIPPKLTVEQRASALAKSTAARQVRASTKARVKAGELTLSAVFELAANDEAIAKMTVAMKKISRSTTDCNGINFNNI